MDDILLILENNTKNLENEKIQPIMSVWKPNLKEVLFEKAYKKLQIELQTKREEKLAEKRQQYGKQTTSRQFLYDTIGKEINKDPKSMDSIVNKFEDNWYDTKESLEEMTEEDFDKIGIPKRVSTKILTALNKSDHKDDKHKKEFENQ